ncbi:MAG: hypothetical protein OEX00_00345, partial [Gammaproteobacteria bacterium]|nr:hypothetical protein [Gammaproteobacteria bacterium]
NIRFRIFHSQYTVEKIDGGEGLNIISGNSTPNYFDFTNTELADISAIDGGDGWDTIKGSQGNDVIIGGPGVDALYGNAGDDTFLVSGFLDGYDYINGGDGFDTILGTDLDDAIGLTKFQFEYSVELIDGGLGTNIIRGNDESSVLDFSNTELKNIAAIYGNGGWDVIAGSQSDDVIIGGSGNDTLFGKKGDDIFRVNGSGDDFDLISGGDGHDRILGSDQDDRIGLVRLDASYHVEVIDGGLGINTIEGNENHNILDFRYTTLVNITAIRGNNGNDSIYGSSSDDLIDGGPGNDSLNGGPGIDTARYSGNRADFSISLLQGIYTVTDLNSTDGNEGSDRLTSFEFIEFADQTISLP